MRQTLADSLAVLEVTELSFDDVIKASVFLVDMRDYAAGNEIYAQSFSPPYPARIAIGVEALALEALVEVELVAVATNSVRPDVRLNDLPRTSTLL
jgi:2-iminobutanoate/2-iminopropanoate deaminase